MRVALVALLLVLASPVTARAAGVDDAAQALKSDPVYVDPSAELAGQVNAEDLRSEIAASGAAPMFIAVLPASAVSGSAGQTLIELRRKVGTRGTYALAVGKEFRTLSDYYNAAAAGDSAFAAHPDDLQAALNAFIDTTATKRKKSGSSGPLAGIAVVLVLLLVAVGGVYLSAQPAPCASPRRPRRRARARPAGGVRPPRRRHPGARARRLAR